MTEENRGSLGEYLRHERERRGITIEQVASATKISVKLLHLLENDNYAELPAKPFIRGFVISYARFIGFNAHEILEKYAQFIETQSLSRPNRESGHSGYVFERKEGEQTRRTLWITMGGFIFLGALALLILKPSLKHRKSTQIEKLKAVHTTANNTTPSPNPSITPSETLREAAETPIPPAPATSEKITESENKPKVEEVKAADIDKNDPLNSGVTLQKSEIKYKIISKALVDVWVRYQCDNRPIMKFILRKDRVLVLRAAQKMKFQASNPQAVEFNYNGRGFRPLGQAKTAITKQGVVSLLLPPELSDNKEESEFLNTSLPLTPGPSPTPSVPLSTPSE